MTVPDEAVEAAAQRVWWEFEGRPWLHATDEMKEPYLYQARLALSAAAPSIAAEARDEGAMAVMISNDIGRIEVGNPYRSRS